MAEASREEKVRQLVDNAPTVRPKRRSNGAAGPPRPKPTVILTRASDVMPEPVTWLWLKWLAVGKVTILAGLPGAGKTSQALSFAATVSIGQAALLL